MRGKTRERKLQGLIKVGKKICSKCGIVINIYERKYGARSEQGRLLFKYAI